jgi:hypothetical protein
MNAEQLLYDVLRPGRDTSIPLIKAAEYFVSVKLASGGLLATEVDLLKKVAEGGISVEDMQDAEDKGLLQGVRSSVAQRIQHGEKLRASKGERWGKALGTAAGAVTGLVAGKGQAADRAVRAGVGALAGHALGKATGQGVDAHRAAAPKTAEIQKEGAGINPAALARLREALGAIDLDSLRDTAISSGVQGGADDALSDTLSTAGGMAGSAMPGRYKIPSIIAGHFAGKGIAGLASREPEAKVARVLSVLQKAAQLNSPTAVGEDEPMKDNYSPETQAQPVSTRDAVGDPMPAEPFVSPDQDLVPNPLEGILDMLQKGNEAEHYQQKAEDAQQVAERAQAAAELAKGQLDQVQKEQEVAVQQQAEELHAARTEATAASGESQMLHQQVMSSQQQVQEAQAQATSLLQGMNQFRQGLIDYLSQDPAQMAAPGMMAPTPGSGQMMQDPSGMGGLPGGDPNAAAMGGDPNAAAAQGQPPAGAPAEAAPAEAAPPAAEGGGESEGGEAAKPAAKKEEGAKGGGKGTVVHVH